MLCTRAVTLAFGPSRFEWLRGLTALGLSVGGCTARGAVDVGELRGLVARLCPTIGRHRCCLLEVFHALRELVPSRYVSLRFYGEEVLLASSLKQAWQGRSWRISMCQYNWEIEEPDCLWTDRGDAVMPPYIGQ